MTADAASLFSYADEGRVEDTTQAMTLSGHGWKRFYWVKGGVRGGINRFVPMASNAHAKRSSAESS